MSRLLIAILVVALLAGAVPVTRWQARRARRHDSVRDCIIRQSLLDPDAAREVDDLELLLSLPAYDPAWDAGRERLWDAARDKQKGDQA